MIRTIRNELTRDLVFSIWLVLLGMLLLVGLVSGVSVFVNGLSLTNLTNEVPWGLWITMDLSSIALGAGAFSLSGMVYLLRIERLRPVARIAVFTGLIGYTGAMLTLLMDIGRPERFWHPLIYWNLRSVLWQITLCVILYSSVLVAEVVPIVLETPPLKRAFPGGEKLSHRLHQFAPVAAVLGVIFSLLHQSAYGATFGILVARPIWFKPSLPTMFIVSAIAAGTTAILGIIIFYENLVKERKIPSETKEALATVGGAMLAFYLYLNIWDFLATTYYSHLPARIESIALVNHIAPYGFSHWVVEIFVGVVIPLIILAIPRLRKQDSLVLFAVLFVIIGLVVNRWNVTLSGLVVPMDWSPGVANVFPINSYRPGWVEWGVGAGVIGYVLLAFTIGLRYLPFFELDTSE